MRRIALALTAGAVCHGLFAVAVASMILGMGLGMTAGLGAAPPPWSWLANLALVAQFPLGHSLLLSRAGRRALARALPEGETLLATTYATVASVQLLALFALWTPSGVVWWRAEGPALWAMLALYGASWLLLAKASLDAGPELQSGFLGWWALARGRRPRYPDMPETGLFRVIRQPIYAAFALTLWTTPVWTPDQLTLAVLLTAYCVLGPRLKERRFARLFGARFDAYRARTPYMLPRLRRATEARRA